MMPHRGTASWSDRIAHHFARALLCAALAAAALAGGAAWAQSATTLAEVARFSVEVIDLDPGDGITAGLTIGDGYYWGRSAYGLGLVAEEIERDELHGFGSTSLVKPFGSAATTVSAGSWTVRSTISGASAGVPSMYAMIGWETGALMTPNTRATFTVSGTIAAHGEGLGAAAWSLVALQLQARPDPPAYVLDTVRGIPEPRAFTLTGSVQSGAAELGVDLFVWTYVEAKLGVPPPVPEPATPALLLAGSSVIAALARRPRHRDAGSGAGSARE